ncbi:hypothetical protein Sjap_000012 [Stephania japonica]|uniref:RNA ligase/cyclic nucleotide phosphodiesterase family protein n=1 Tax=Stephania japonica TaxID=461633 RepID=A0AAP0KH96_9MAGN
MEALRSDFGGPEFDPHITLVGAIRLTESEALDKFRSACEDLKRAYSVQMKSVSCGTFFYQCVYLQLQPTPQDDDYAALVIDVSAHCTGHFGYKSFTLKSIAYMPHLSLLYGDLTEEEKQRAKEKVEVLDSSLSSLTFDIDSIALCKTDTEDKTLKSWEKIALHRLD